MATSDPTLVARPVPCLNCAGRGCLPVVACGWCAFEARVTVKTGGPCPPPDWHFPEDLESEALSNGFPCGHPVGGWTAEHGQIECPTCQGSGTGQAWKTAEAWARQDAKDAREKKQARSQAAKALSECGPGLGYTKKGWRQLIRFLRPVCEAEARQSGQPCKNPVVHGKLKCRLHGGLSTGAKTAEGRARIGESNRRRQKASRVLGSEGMGSEGNADAE